MGCDLCGKDGELFRTIIEGAQVVACEKCSSFGKVLGPYKSKTTVSKESKKTPAYTLSEPKIIQSINSDYPSIIRKARERSGMTQKEFALKIAEKESVVHKLEAGIHGPDVGLARKLEKLLRVKLIEEIKEERFDAEKGKSAVMTIADIIKK